MRSRKIRVEDRSGQRAMAGHAGNGKDTNVRSEEPAGVGTGRG